MMNGYDKQEALAFIVKRIRKQDRRAPGHGRAGHPGRV